MRGQELVALAGAHGIKLEHIQLNGAAAPRAWLDGCEIIPGARSSSGSEWRRSRRPAREEARALEEPAWLAARYSFAGDENCYWPLWWCVLSQAQRMARRESWSPHVRGVRGELRFYLLDLVQLTLDEEANRPLFVAAPQLRALYMQVEAYTWGEALAPRYRVLQAVYQRWLGTARELIGVSPQADEINHAHAMARSSAEEAVKWAIRCGELLLEQKARTKHGEFEHWVAANCGFAASTARLYVHAAKQNANGLAISSLRGLFPSGQRRKSKGTVGKRAITTVPSIPDGRSAENAHL